MTSAFIGFGFFFPRWTLFICWLASWIPPNDTPFILDFLAAMFAPRLLIAWWLYVAGAHPGLVILFTVFGVLELLGGGSTVSSRND